ncbi:hypothetical protein LTR28_007917 [Elasticomyces elasticus]|nr:hypothetical protein LTR28_007917 [Elasticomyces elasticus]
MSQSLAGHLLDLDPQALHKATTHPFLLAAATASLPTSILTAWLAQDRLYALSYVPFIGTLLSKCALSSSSDRSESLQWRIADMLIDCLANIRRELNLFEDTARKQGWEEQVFGPGGNGVRPRVQTRAYMDLFAGAAAAEKSVLVGMTALWATEECYLRSWRYAAASIATPERGDAAARDVMRTTFIPNWSSEVFEAFVRRLKGLVDELAQGVAREEVERCEDAWRQVVWAEENFWPEVTGLQ